MRDTRRRRRRHGHGRGRGRGASPRWRGFMFTDTVAGLLVVGVLAGVIFVAVNRHNRATARLAEERQALRLVERALLELQAGGSTKAAAQVRRLPSPSPSPAAGKIWVEVTAQHGERRASIVGLVDAAAALAAAPPAAPPATSPATRPAAAPATAPSQVGGKEGP